MTLVCLVAIMGCDTAKQAESNQRIDLGAVLVDPDDPASHELVGEFTVRNPTSRVLDVEISSVSCGCAKVEIGEQILPQQSLRGKLIVRVPGIREVRREGASIRLVDDEKHCVVEQGVLLNCDVFPLIGCNLVARQAVIDLESKQPLSFQVYTYSNKSDIKEALEVCVSDRLRENVQVSPTVRTETGELVKFERRVVVDGEFASDVLSEKQVIQVRCGGLSKSIPVVFKSRCTVRVIPSELFFSKKVGVHEIRFSQKSGDSVGVERIETDSEFVAVSELSPSVWRVVLRKEGLEEGTHGFLLKCLVKSPRRQLLEIPGTILWQAP